MRQEGRIDAIDGLRGLAAVSVAFVFHWQHFWGPPPQQVWFLSPRPLQWLQIYGWLGVDLFFLLSGFIFARNYAAGIAGGRVSGREFFVRRMSRLYPLHLLTLAVAAVIAWSMFATLRAFPIYLWNDLYHLFLNVAFAQGTGLQYGYSFNGPSWTLSLEGMCYAIFYFICRYAPRNRELTFVAMAFVGASLLKINPPEMLPLINQPLGRALTGFFCGCLICTAVNARMMPWLRWVALGHLAFGAFTALLLGSLWAGVGSTFYLSFDLVILPCLLICSLGFAPLRAVLSSTPLQVLGALSYSIYLLHAVVQMAITFFFRYFELSIPARSFWFFAAYVGGVAVLAAIVHRHYEMPVQSWIRSRLLTEKFGTSIALDDTADRVSSPANVETTMNVETPVTAGRLA